MRYSSRTGVLAAVAVAALSIQFFPNQANLIKVGLLALAVVYLLVWALRKFPSQLRQKTQRKAQQTADDRDYRQYEAELAAIRERHGVALGDGEAEISMAYRDELVALHAKYQPMLDRKFGSGGGRSFPAAP